MFHLNDPFIQSHILLNNMFKDVYVRCVIFPDEPIVNLVAEDNKPSTFSFSAKKNDLFNQDDVLIRKNNINPNHSFIKMAVSPVQEKIYVYVHQDKFKVNEIAINNHISIKFEGVDSFITYKKLVVADCIINSNDKTISYTFKQSMIDNEYAAILAAEIKEKLSALQFICTNL